MSLARMMDTACTILRATSTTDRRNDTTLDWSDPAEVATVCWVADTSTSEVIGGRDALVAERKCYLPADTDITGRDRVRIDDDVYLINGPVTRARRPGRGVHHIELKLRLVAG